jgi:protein associated with RNAse G/E
MNYIGHWLAVQCFKHDGNIHRLWDRGLVLENNEDFIVIVSKRAKVTESNGRTWFTKEPAVTIFSKKEWWNVICMIKDNGVCYYCNIASPCIIDKNYIKYIDYDLDIKLFPNDDTRLLDEKKYLRHKDQYHYESDLDEVLRYQTNDILDKMHKREFPFNDQVIQDYYDDYLQLVKK